MNKIIVVSIFVLCASFAAAAQSDAAAKAVLDKAIAKFKTYKVVQSNFNLKTESASGKVQSSKSGTLLLKSEKYRVTTAEQELFCDGATVWTYDKTANEVVVAKLDKAPNTIGIERLFTDFYDKGFVYKLNGEKKQGAKTIQEIEMTPTDKSKTFYKVYLFIDKITQTVYSASILEKNGNKYTYTINSLNGNAVAADSQFVFDKSKYPGVKVMNLADNQRYRQFP